MDKDFRTPWAKPIPYEEWVNFLAHDFNDRSRDVTYEIIQNYVKDSKSPLTFVEMGFGQCLDFERCLRELHDEEKIVYCGVDITEQFVDYANQKHPSYQFEHKGFNNFNARDWDITYTRHTLEHQHPYDYKLALFKMLNATRKLCIITWFQPPGEKENICWTNNGFDNAGAWVNTYYKSQVLEVIENAGFIFDRPIIDIDRKNHIYVLRRK